MSTQTTNRTADRLFAVTGVTGNTGRATAEALLERGARVRVVVRSADKGADWAARGAEVAIADLSDRAALTEALRGTDGAYVLLPPQMAAADPIAATVQLARTVAQAAANSQVPHVVLLSSVGAQHPDGTGPIKGLHQAEAVFAEASLNATFLRAGFFAENWLMVLPAVQTDGVLPSFLPAGAAMPQVSVADIGRAAAHALLSVAPRGQAVVELAGPRDVSDADVAAALGRALGKPVEAVNPPLDQVAPTFTSMGMPAPVAELYAEMYRGIAQGLVAWQGAPTRGQLELDDWARQVVG